MSRFNRISNDAFSSLQTEAGVILTTFDPYNPYRTPLSGEILATTTGNVTPSCVANTQDYGADVNGVPDGMMEFKQITGYTCSLTFTSIKFNAANTKWALGAADITTLSNGVKKIKPRRNLKQEDFSTIWWVGDKADGGAYAIKIYNALSTAGLTISAAKNGKGTMQQTITAHTSVNNQDDVAMEFYDIPPEDTAAVAAIRYALTNVTSTEDDEAVDIGDGYTTTLAAVSPYVMKSVHILMGGTDITADVYTSGTGGVEITAVTADLDIIAEAGTQVSITKSLTHVTSTNPAATAFEGDAYETTLEPASGYTMDSVTVTMDGTDITSTAYTAETGKVSIASVSGAIVITATAE